VSAARRPSLLHRSGRARRATRLTTRARIRRAVRRHLVDAKRVPSRPAAERIRRAHLRHAPRWVARFLERGARKAVAERVRARALCRRRAAVSAVARLTGGAGVPALPAVFHVGHHVGACARAPRLARRAAVTTRAHLRRRARGAAFPAVRVVGRRVGAIRRAARPSRAIRRAVSAMRVVRRRVEATRAARRERASALNGADAAYACPRAAAREPTIDERDAVVSALAAVLQIGRRVDARPAAFVSAARALTRSVRARR